MKNVIGEIINIDGEVVKIKEDTQRIIAERENEIKIWLKKIEEEEWDKAKDEIDREYAHMDKETQRQMEEITALKEEQLGKIKSIFEKSREQLAQRALDKIIEP